MDETTPTRRGRSTNAVRHPPLGPRRGRSGPSSLKAGRTQGAQVSARAQPSAPRRSRCEKNPSRKRAHCATHTNAHAIRRLEDVHQHKEVGIPSMRLDSIIADPPAGVKGETLKRPAGDWKTDPEEDEAAPNGRAPPEADPGKVVVVVSPAKRWGGADDRRRRRLPAAAPGRSAPGPARGRRRRRRRSRSDSPGPPGR